MNNKNREIDLSEIFSILWSSKLLISCNVFIFTLIAVIYSLSLTNLFTSSVLLQVTESENNNSLSNMTSQYSGIASLAGISMPSASSNKSDYAIETIKSRIFLKHLLTFDEVRENLMAAVKYDSKLDKITYDQGIYDASKNEWIRDISFNRKRVPTHIETHPIYLKNININKDTETGFIKISFTHLSPSFSKEFLDLVVSELNTVSKKRDLEEAELALVFLQDLLLQVQQADIRKSINQLIEAQIKTKMFANIRNDYLLKDIDQAFIPETKTSPKRLVITILGLFLGLVSSILLVLIRYYTFNKPS